MRRNVLAPLAFLALIATARDACAEESPAPAPVPALGPIPVRVRLLREGEIADVLVLRDGKWDFGCRTPCTFDAVPGAQLRIEVLGHDDKPLFVTVPTDARGRHDIDIGRRGRSELVGGLVAIGAGAISLALGMAIIRNAGPDDLFGSDGANRTAARILLFLGGASAGSGGLLILFRSTAPVVVPTNRAQAHDDLAPPPSATPTTPTSFTPARLGWTIRF